jgi:predicted ester cyclase
MEPVVMSTPKLVEDFYRRIWNDGNLDAAAELLTPEFSFRGSLGNEMRGREQFKNYVRSVRGSLADYRCEILSCVAEGNQAFAKMRFSGRHVAAFRGYEPTGKIVEWLGAALFRFEGSMIAELWVLGGLAGLDALLRTQAGEGAQQ